MLCDWGLFLEVWKAREEISRKIVPGRRQQRGPMIDGLTRGETTELLTG